MKASVPAAARQEQPNRDLDIRILQSPLSYVADKLGADAVRLVTNAAGLEPEEIVGFSRWISHRQFEAILSAARGLMQDEAEFLRACAYKMEQGYGPLRWLLRATSVPMLWKFGAKTMHLVSSVSRYEILGHTDSSIQVRYHSDRKESRLLCLSRHARVTAWPTLFGLPQGTLEETCCVSEGDSYCEYLIRWHERPRLRYALLGVVLGFVAAVLAGTVAGGSLVGLFVLPVLGAALGWILELSRANKANLAMGEDMNKGLREMAGEASEAREELLALTQRQEQWTNLLEEQMESRTAVLHDVLRRVERIKGAQVRSIRGFSHDMRNPLTVIRLHHALLENELADDQRESVRESLAGMEIGLVDIRKLLDGLMESVTRQTRGPALSIRAVDVAALKDRIRGHLKALVLGRDIRVSVISTREAPAVIATDPLLFNRVVDNLLSNAAKYTEQGSILVEIDGLPNQLCLKISDTGRGISEKRFEEVFHKDEALPDARMEDSHGIGLTVVVRLLYQLAGRLEVMSHPAKGTTFWVRFPVDPPEMELREHDSDVEPGEIVGKVLTIRRNLS